MSSEMNLSKYKQISPKTNNFSENSTNDFNKNSDSVKNSTMKPYSRVSPRTTNNKNSFDQSNSNSPTDINLNNQSLILEKSDEKTKSVKKNDSPAFRLRPRRSTPKKMDSAFSAVPTTRKFSIFSPNSSEQLQAKVAKLKTNSGLTEIKKNLFNETDKAETKSRSQSPSNALVEDIDLNVFAENQLIQNLNEEGKNSINYICLRIIEVLNETVSNKDEILKIYCQQADESKEIINKKNPIVLLYLFNEYTKFKNRLEPGKIIEIVKFEVKKLNDVQTYAYESNELNIYPFLIELKANKQENWISLISLKKKFEPTNLNLLNVINTQNRNQNNDFICEQNKKSKVVFSSYVVKSESLENNSIKNTKSPTLKRFMKTINKSYDQEHKLKIKIKKNF